MVGGEEREKLTPPHFWYTILDMKTTTEINLHRCIENDPDICHGKPCFRGTRIVVHLVLELLAAGIPIEEIVGPHYYPQLTRDHVAAALHYASELLKTRVYVPQGAL